MLLKYGEVKEYSPGEVLIKEGDAPTFVLLVLTGKMQVFVKHQRRDLVLNDAGPGTILGELAVLCGIPRSASVRASEKSAALQWSAAAFRSPPSPRCFLVGADIPGVAPHPHRERALADRFAHPLARRQQTK